MTGSLGPGLSIRIGQQPSARSFEDWNLDRFAVNHSVALSRLVGCNREQRALIYSFYKSVSQGIENCTKGADIFCVGNMLLRLGANGTIIHNGATGNAIRATVNKDRWIDKVSIRVSMTGPHFGNLAGGAGNAVLMTFGTRRGVKNGTEPGAWVMTALELGLIKRERVTRRLCDSVADALRTRSSQ